MKKYNILYADPPWKYKDPSLERGGAERYYQTMTVQQIADLPVRYISADNSVLFLWVTWPFLFEAELVLWSWGFTYKTIAFVWLKTNARRDPAQGSFFADDYFAVDDFLGMGRWTRSNTEFCILATRGKPKRASANVRQLIFAPIMKHSQKPAEVRSKIVTLAGDRPRLELFARYRAIGWDVYGDEVPGSIKLPVVSTNRKIPKEVKQWKKQKL
jgi:N6-adenosine-specific RNA methylase IME4